MYMLGLKWVWTFSPPLCVSVCVLASWNSDVGILPFQVFNPTLLPPGPEVPAAMDGEVRDFSDPFCIRL